MAQSPEDCQIIPARMSDSLLTADQSNQTLTAQGILNDTSMERDICNKLDDIDERMSAQFKMLRDTINMLAEQLHRQHVDFMEKMDKIIEALQEITESLRDLIRALRESNSTFTINGRAISGNINITSLAIVDNVDGTLSFSGQMQHPHAG